jgi:acetyl-CoA carboxylase alpha subunit
MTVVETVATSGGYKVFSSENATLATAIAEVINELETHNIPLCEVQFVLTYDDNNNKYAFVAVCG